jgi:DNA-binding XRE family transcriptional regulator
MTELLVKSIRVLGDKAAAARAWLDDAVPAARVVGNDEPAEYILMRPEDLDELLEDAAAVAAYHHTRKQEDVPAAVVRRLVACENPVKVWREHRGMTLQALGDSADLGKGYLSQIENGERQGTVSTLKRIAEALNVDLDDLI